MELSPEYKLRQRFLKNVLINWHENTRGSERISSVYALISMDMYGRNLDIAYIGSSKDTFKRYRSHPVPDKIRKNGLLSCMYFIPINDRFLDYEIKLIRKLKPKFNKKLYPNG